MEHSPWVAERVAAGRPFPSVDDLGGAFGEALRDAAATTQADVLRAHPELGAANLERLTRASQGEQRGAALDRLDDATRARLLEVNAAYRERHGFPLVIAVRGHTVDSLIAFGASRVENATDAELATSVEQVARIAAARVADRVVP